jgi:hypothetical protein
LKRQSFFLIFHSGMKAQLGDGIERILLGDSTGGRAVRLWPIMFQCVGVWILSELLCIVVSVWS